MTPPASTPEPRTYFERNAHQVWEAASTPALRAVDSLLICFLTILDFLNILFDPKTNLATGISYQFIDEIMLRDFTYIINYLKDYKGNERRGVWEALTNMNSAIQDLYSAYASSLQKSEYQRVISKVRALGSCRNKLHAAYLQLEYLKELAKQIRPNL